MFCVHCGKQIEDASVFCPYCKKVLLSNDEITQNAHATEQAKVCTSLRKDVKSWTIAMLVFLFLGIGFFMLIFVALSSEFWMYFLLLLSLGSLVLSYKCLEQRNRCKNEFLLAQRDYFEYERMLEKKRISIQKERERERREWEITHPVCPVCSSRDTYRISDVNRMTSVAVWGLASSKIGKQYACNQCKHKW